MALFYRGNHSSVNHFLCNLDASWYIPAKKPSIFMHIQNASPNVCCFLSGNGCLGHLWPVVLTWLEHLTVLGVLISIPHGINLDKSFISAQLLKHNQTLHRAIMY